MTKLHKLVSGKKYRLLRDYTDIIYGLVPKGSILIFDCPNLGYAKFRYGWKDIAIKPKEAFKILEEI